MSETAFAAMLRRLGDEDLAVLLDELSVAVSKFGEDPVETLRLWLGQVAEEQRRRDSKRHLLVRAAKCVVQARELNDRFKPSVPPEVQARIDGLLDEAAGCREAYERPLPRTWRPLSGGAQRRAAETAGPIPDVPPGPARAEIDDFSTEEDDGD